MCGITTCLNCSIVAPARERGLKFRRWSGFGLMAIVAPARERGLKLRTFLSLALSLLVAPARERGLKFRRWSGFGLMAISRSRKGAWIEMSPLVMLLNTV